MSKKYDFLNKKSSDIIWNINNLQVILWKEKNKKRNNCSIIYHELKQLIDE
jgi:hypothetical protein